MGSKIKTLKNFYLLVLGVLVLLMIFTPWLITRGFSFFDEEFSEVVSLALLSLVGFFIYYLYQKEAKQQEEALVDAQKHIGKINLQIAYFKDTFCDIKKYPRNKSELKYIFDTFSQKILGSVNVPWVLFRVVDTQKTKTLTEFFLPRGVKEKNSAIVYPNIGNKSLIKNNGKSYLVFTSSQDNFNVKAFSIVPKKAISEDEAILLKRVASDLEMIYLIYSSYCQNEKDTR